MAANKVVRNDQAHRLFASFNIMKGRNEYTTEVFQNTKNGTAKLTSVEG